MQQPRRPAFRSVMVAASVLVALAGCSGVPGNDNAAARVASRFSAAISSADAASACDLLAAGTKTALEADSGMPCTEALLELELPGGEVVDTQAFGRAAESVLDSDVVFLTLASDGWRVTAAGCTAHTDRPYSCDLKGE